MWCTPEPRPIQPGTPLGAYSTWLGKGMVGKELEAGTVDCSFPNVRRTYWRSATWSSHSGPPSPKLQPFDLEGTGSTAVPLDTNALPSTPRVQQNQSNRCRAPLPPLQPLSVARKNLDEWPSAGLDDLGGDWPAVPATPGNRKTKTGLDIKLDLASIQRNVVEPTEIQRRRDKFAHFDKQCSRVANHHIYLGSDAVARDRETLRANGITHVLNCVGFVCPEYFKRELKYKTLWLQDSPCEDITSLLYDVFDYFEDVKEQGGRVFVHCCQGVSRSTSLVIAYLMWREHRSFEDAFQDVKAARGITNPNMGFACQLLQCQKRVHATPMSPNSVLRMYRLAPHSPYDPLHLVPKPLTNPGARCLDSRGAFVIHLPQRILVWIGRECDSKIAQSAKEAAGQVVRYERADGLVQVLLEGCEVPEFWESLSKCSVTQDEGSNADTDAGCMESNLNAAKEINTNQSEVDRVRQLGVGNRKVPFYDSDYILYRTAKQGGIIPPVPFTGVGMANVTTRIPSRDDGWSLLRRKFLSGKLVSVASSEKMEIGAVSPDTSADSLSPHLSPSSPTSTSSSTVSPFASPVSLLGNLSPDALRPPSTPFLTPVAQFGKLSPCSPRTPYATPVSELRKLSRDAFQGPASTSLPIGLSPSHPYHPFISSLYIPSSVKNQATPSANKGSTISLAQRRGSVTPNLQLPGSENDPPPAPRGMSRKPKLPPIVTTEKSRAEQVSDKEETTSFGFEALGGMLESLTGESQNQTVEEVGLPSSCVHSLERVADNAHCARDLPIGSVSAVGDSQVSNEKVVLRPILKNGHALLYQWPGLEKIDMFDADDLDTRAVFIVLATLPHTEESEQDVRIFVWVGRKLAANQGDSRSEGDAVWHKLGRHFLEQMLLPSDIPIRVVNQGQESEDFWALLDKD